jgi:hypothetical protein
VRLRALHRIALAGASLIAALLGGCDTVDVGPPTGPPMGCNASTAFFVTDVWPKYLGPAAPGYNCGQSACHDANAGHGYFRLMNPSDGPPAPTDPPSSWPDDWRFNYTNSARLLNCADPTSSLIDTVPSGRGQPHPPGDVVTDHAAADMLFAMWATAP